MASTKTLRRTEIGPPSSACALMFKIDWTSAKVVKMTARRDFKLRAVTVDTRTGVEIASAPTPILKGTVLYFAASDSAPGYYYLTRVIGETISCSCPSHKGCKHQPRVADFLAGIFHKEPAKQPAPTPVQPEPVQPEYSPIKRRSVAEWKEATKRNKAWQRQQKDADLVKLKAVREQDRLAAGVA